MNIVFLSYSTRDKQFVKRLAGDLQALGYEVWLDEWEIRVGDSIVKSVQVGIDRADFVAVVLSRHSTRSQWVENEWQSKYWQEVERRSVMVLPILIDDCTVPALLRPKKYADFRRRYEVGLVSLAQGLQPRQQVSGISRYFVDFVDIGDTWIELFSRSLQLDLLMMYSATWRNTYLKNIRDLLAKPGGRLRVVLPDLEPKSPLLRVYAERMGMSPLDLRKRISEAANAFAMLAREGAGAVEVYAIPVYYTHACYLFDAGAVLALYSYRPSRVPSPACLLEQGELLQFLRADFEWLVSPQNPKRRLILT